MKNNKNNKNVEFNINIPEGCFFSNNCTGCIYANFRDTDSDGWIKCNNSHVRGTYVDPSDRYGCFYFES